MKTLLSRRKMLVSLGLGTGAFALRELVGVRAAAADADPLAEVPLLVFAYFNGGWDTLASLDPRNAKLFADPEGGVQPGYGLMAENDPVVAQIMQQSGGTGLVKPAGSQISFGPAIGKMASHHSDIAVVRGMTMGTLAHEVGRRYFVTGKFPRGLAASGSALATWLVSQDPSVATIPNLVVGGVETYNEGLDPRASGLMVGGVGDLGVVLKPVDEEAVLPLEVDDALLAYQQAQTCSRSQLDADGMIASHRAAYERARLFMGGTLWQHFDFKANPAPEILEAYQHFGIDPVKPNADLAGSKGQALIAAQALTKGICQAVSLQPARGLDTHDATWESDQAERQREGWDALADLIDWLKLKTDSNGKPFWNRTVLVCFSEFARTPKINYRGGRDHHLTSACLVAGMGIKGNTVIGATTDDTFSGKPIDLATGLPDPNGVDVRPADVHATVCQAMGLSHQHISNQEPKVITAMLA